MTTVPAYPQPGYQYPQNAGYGSQQQQPMYGYGAPTAPQQPIAYAGQHPQGGYGAPASAPYHTGYGEAAAAPSNAAYGAPPVAYGGQAPAPYGYDNHSHPHNNNNNNNVYGASAPAYAQPGGANYTAPPEAPVLQPASSSVVDYADKPNPYPTGGYVAQAEKAVRMGFIRKVYSVLTVQLLVTFGIVCIFSFVSAVRNYVQSHLAFLWIAIAISFTCIIALACCNGVAQRYPGNFICLGIFTLAEAYLVGVIASTYAHDVVAYAMLGTVLLTVGLTIFAWQTKIDFTALSGTLFVVLLSFIIFGIAVGILGREIPVLHLLYATIGLIIFGIFIIYDTQLIIGGKGRHAQYSIDDYVFAALNLYLDIIQVFLYLLRLLGSRD